MTELRLATGDDFEAVKEMSLKFLKESPYRDLSYDIPKIEAFIRLFLENKGASLVCILAVSPKGIPIGIIAGQLSSVPFSLDTIAAETMWWVDPDYRGRSRAAVELLRAFEHWGRIRGSSFIQMQSLASLNEFKVASILGKFGYEQKEIAYLKELV